MMAKEGWSSSSEMSPSNDENLLQPGDDIRPIVGLEQVPGLVKNLFGLTVTSVTQLSSYDDKNFHIQVSKSVNNPHLKTTCPHGYVLKILNTKTSQKQKLVAAQNDMMIFLMKRGIMSPQPEKNVDGSSMILMQLEPKDINITQNNVKLKPKKEHIVRLLTFIPGKTLYQVRSTPNLFFEFGSYIAHFDNQLKEFQNEEVRSVAHVWMLKNILHVRKFTYVLDNNEHRQLIHEVIDAWEKEVTPIIHQLEKGIIHGDFNDQNILVQPDDKDPSVNHITGVLDLGDIQYSCYLFELAITIMYPMVEVKVMPPLDVGGHILAGYLTHRDIPQQELDILKVCVAARFAQSLVYGAYTHQQDPDNDYLLATAARGWNVLHNFWNIPKNEVIARWKEIIQSYKE
ncbi:hypothetical protein Pmani_002939 [Petrolisthes manimaculis]|uniref:Hydroxylysine kinase n=1 Tax=Petrolisthes manimaculis TaxID=1843537 RepID=A0AAE1QGL4_9EUCA|nr:hypothetical protein Pmani_002939 [Petrolisthes manimaculis]